MVVAVLMSKLSAQPVGAQQIHAQANDGDDDRKPWPVDENG